MPAEGGRKRRGALFALVLVALAAFAWWLSGRWLERPAQPASEDRAGRPPTVRR